MSGQQRKMKFVRTLFQGPAQIDDGELITLMIKSNRASLPKSQCQSLISQGVLMHKDGQLLPTEDAKAWLKRQQLNRNAQNLNIHVPQPVQSGNDTIVRLSKVVKDEAAFLAPHHVEAANRIGRLIEKSQLRPSITQNLSVLPQTPLTRSTGGDDISDMAIDSRKHLVDLIAQLPKDCAGVVIDICGFNKGLQQVEFERGWPRRSAKLVLRMALDRIAEFWRLDASATGNKTNIWG